MKPSYLATVPKPKALLFLEILKGILATVIVAVILALLPTVSVIVHITSYVSFNEYPLNT